MIATVRITDLKLKTIIGTKPKERRHKQDVVINVIMCYNATKAIAKDNISQAVDYEEISKKISKKVSASHFILIEKLADFILKIVMADKRIIKAKIRIDKPKALRTAKSVSVELEAKR